MRFSGQSNWGDEYLLWSQGKLHVHSHYGFELDFMAAELTHPVQATHKNLQHTHKWPATHHQTQAAALPEVVYHKNIHIVKSAHSYKVCVPGPYACLWGAEASG